MVYHSVLCSSLTQKAPYVKSRAMTCLWDVMWMRFYVSSKRFNLWKNMEKFVLPIGNLETSPWTQVCPPQGPSTVFVCIIYIYILYICNVVISFTFFTAYHSHIRIEGRVSNPIYPCESLEPLNQTLSPNPIPDASTCIYNPNVDTIVTQFLWWTITLTQTHPVIIRPHQVQGILWGRQQGQQRRRCRFVVAFGSRRYGPATLTDHSNQPLINHANQPL